MPLPAVDQIKWHGLAVVEMLKPHAPGTEGRAELRTIELSIQTLQAGLEAAIGIPKGSPYLESREEAIAANLVQLVKRHSKVLALYGSDHISRKMRMDGGPERNEPFKPMALRLRERAIRAYSLLTVPLQAEVQWRGRRTRCRGPPTAGCPRETFDRMLASDPGSEVFFIDRQRSEPEW